MLDVLFGSSFDGGVHPAPLAGGDAAAGRLHLGRAGLIARLELALGIPTGDVPRPLRVARLARRLHDLDDGRRFYSASRNADPWRVASRLLGLRDELALAGWRGEAPPGGSDRLRDLAALEAALTRDSPPPGEPDRLRRILARLDLLPSGIRRLEIADPEETLPALFRELFRKLEQAGTALENWAEPRAPGRGDLALAKAALLAPPPPSPPSPGETSGDGSLLRLEARSVAEAAEATCAFLSSLPRQGIAPGSAVLIRDGAPRSWLLLEGAMRAHDLPAPGLRVESSHRPATQILPLFLGLTGDPVDPELLVQFLTLPSSPIPGEARARLVGALGEAPGYDSDAWREARRACIEAIRKKGGDRRARSADRKIARWLDEVERTPARDPLPVRDAIRHVKLVEEWAARRAGALGSVENEAPFRRQAWAQAALLARILELHPRPDITRPELGRLLADVLRTGIAFDLAPRQAGSFATVRDPACVAGETDAVVWWHCVGASAPREPPLFWDEEEIEALARCGCRLPPPAWVHLARARTWRRPILAAARRVLLIQPERAFGEPLDAHPIWDEIASRLAPGEGGGAVGRLTLDAASLLEGRPGTPIRSIASPREGLPGPSPRRHLPADLLAPRPKESPTSIEKLLACPLHWTLHYAAGMREPLAGVLPRERLLRGKLAHKLVGDYLAEHAGLALPEPEEAAREIGRRFDASLPREAAPLALPGMERQKTSVRGTLVCATRALVALLQRGGYRIENVEHTRERELLLGRLAGRTDLTVRRTRDGLPAIVDLKWTSTQPKVDALASGTAVQLAAYSYLAREGDRWPPTAYFVLPTAELCSTHPEAFPGCRRVAGPGEREVWERIAAGIEAVRRELERGEVRAACVQGGGDEPEGIPLRIEPPCRWCEFSLFCGYEEAPEE